MKPRPGVTIYTVHLLAEDHAPSKASKLPWVPLAGSCSFGLQPAPTVLTAHIQRHHACQEYLYHGDGRTRSKVCSLLPPVPVIRNLVGQQHIHCSFCQEYPSLPFVTLDLSANGVSSVRPSVLPGDLAIPAVKHLFSLVSPQS